MSVKLTYHREGDYLIPNLAVPEDISTGVWSIRRMDYLKRHRIQIHNFWLCLSSRTKPLLVSMIQISPRTLIT